MPLGGWAFSYERGNPVILQVCPINLQFEFQKFGSQTVTFVNRSLNLVGLWGLPKLFRGKALAHTVSARSHQGEREVVRVSRNTGVPRSKETAPT